MRVHHVYRGRPNLHLALGLLSQQLSPRLHVRQIHTSVIDAVPDRSDAPILQEIRSVCPISSGDPDRSMVWKSAVIEVLKSLFPVL